MNFRLHAWRFRFDVIDSITFAPLLPKNTFRGAFGHLFRKIACEPQCNDAKTCTRAAECHYARMFEPRANGGPSGFADTPRPFAFRARGLAGKKFAAGDTFEIDIHVFDLRSPAFAYFTSALAQLEHEGLGQFRSRAKLQGVENLDASGQPCSLVYDGGRILTGNLVPIDLPLDRTPSGATKVCVHFLTPTEIKDSSGGAAPTFAGLMGRIRDRISTLRDFYGDGPLEMDFREFGERSRAIRLVDHNLNAVEAERRSSRTGQRHPLGGFLGSITYEGDLAEFLPWLEAAYWTGVGRQTVWGKGVVQVISQSDR